MQIHNVWHYSMSGSFATWEKHTKGIGSKLLQKFGFTGRLGAREDGISKAIEVTLRPTKQGLGFGDDESRQNSTKQVAPSEFATDRKSKAKHKRSQQESDDDDDSDSSVDDGVDLHDFFKSSAQETTGTIVDMRNKDTQIFHSFSEVIDTRKVKRDRESEEFISFNNSHKFVAKRVKRELADTQIIKIKIESDISSSRQIKRNEAANVVRLESLRQKLHSVVTLLDSLNVTAKVQLKFALGHLKDIYSTFPDEFSTFGVHKIIQTYLVQVFQCTGEPHPDYIVDVNSSLEEVKSFANYFDKDNSFSIACDIRRSFQQILEEAFVPQLRRFLANSWRPSESDYVILLMENLQSIISETTMEELINHSLLPKFHHEISSWVPTANPIHIWLISWIPFLKAKLSQIFPEIRRKLTSFIKRYNPADEEALSYILPWYGVFDSSSFDNFLGQAIIPRIIDAIRNKFEVNPNNQLLDVLHGVLLWKKILTSDQVSYILAGEFFPKWFKTLFAWLSMPNPDLEEIAMWYDGWKSFFPSDLLASNHFLLRNFSLAVEMINDYIIMDNAAFIQKYNRILAEKNKITFYTLTRLNNLHNKLQEKQVLMHQYKSNTSLKDLLEIFAEKHGIEFKPKFNKSIEGKQIWEFGKDLCYLENNVIFFQEREDKSGNQISWKPISIEDLVDRANISKR